MGHFGSRSSGMSSPHKFEGEFLKWSFRPTHVLAHRFGCLFLLAGLSGVLPGIRRGLAGARSNGGILAPATVEAALLPSGDTLTVIQVVLLGLVAASGFWGGFATLGGSRSLGPHGRQFAQGGDEGCGGEKDEVRNSAGPRRRVGVHDRDRGTEATMAPVRREPDGERCRRDWRGSWALRRLQRLPAAWGEGSQKPEVSHLHPHCIPGPFEQWKACCRVYRAAFMMLDIRTMATCAASRPTSRSSTGCMREHGT